MSHSPPRVTVDDAIAASSACSESTNWDMTGFERLFEKGWDINSSLGHVGDVLSMAVSADKLPAVRFHLDHGADPNANLRGETYSALELAPIANVGLEIVSLLLRHGAVAKGRSAMLFAAQKGRVDMMDMFLDAGVSVDEVPDNDDVYDNARAQVDWGTPLHGAAGNGQSEAVMWLLRKGASRDVKNSIGLTPKEVARQKGYSDCERLLRTP
ncbi:ankyrin [Hypoxylon rubiginosum]|uniref:Ankyrin n=1 Tax=Hypoxylon rubiginosum TaxID=110542 RepID=A0ACB9YKB0_9PEZI|nr:ankyrin [Hypoxylon rubiginosum]